ncbi:hypothetical protein LG329_04730 [Virgibacillus necropolis]|uniref:hypothetical protein n=1 Tax=Virgibacillus necropolis TaxID=163877 RepID=UPI0038506A27
MKKIEKHRKEVQSLDEILGCGWALIKYPNRGNGEVIYSCNAGHIFEMKPKVFLKYKSCPICEIKKEVKRDNTKYNSFLKQAQEFNDGKCELTGDIINVDVHHLYSIRKFAELSYNPKNAILLNRGLHKEYHRKYSPYNTHSYTFLAWLRCLRDETKPEGVTTEAINKLISKVEGVMQDLEIKVAQKRLITSQIPILTSFQKSITNKQALKNMMTKADGLLENKNTNHGETIELANGDVIILHVYFEPYIFYKNDFGNWLEYNPISGSILENAYNTIVNRQRD